MTSFELKKSRTTALTFYVVLKTKIECKLNHVQNANSPLDCDYMKVFRADHRSSQFLAMRMVPQLVEN